MPPQPILPLVLAHANAGALAEARRLLREAGLEASRSDPAVLAIRGRLLKEEARAAQPAARALLYAEAAEAYAAAGTLSGATHHLINAASLWRLAGDAAASQAMARRVLASLDANPEEPETPYWLGATRAEALLLLGRADEARRALAEAVALAPRAYEDHAPTLRQFRLLCAVLEEDAAWLDALAPPRSLHFAGHMGVRADDAGLRAAVRRLLAEETIGFAFGALAAGADIVIAEELLAGGVELDLVLPTDPQTFRAASVAVLGADWARRYDALLGAGVEVKIAGEAGAVLAAPALQLAAEVAMGLAAMRAQSLQTEAIQLVVLEDGAASEGEGDAEARGADWARRRWAESGRRQIVIPAVRNGNSPPGQRSDPRCRLVALLAVECEPAALDAIARALPSGVVLAGPATWSQGSLLLPFAGPVAAAEAARTLRAALGAEARMAAHYGTVTVQDQAQLGAPVLGGGALDMPRAILGGVPTGAWHVSETFAAGLAAARPGARAILVGELAGTPILAL